MKKEKGHKPGPRGYHAQLFELLSAMTEGEPTIGIIDVRHESHCRLLRGKGDCNCHAEVKVRADA